MDWIEGLTMLTLLLKLIPVLPQAIDAIKAAAAELESNDPAATKLKEVATELEAIAAAVEKQLGD